VPTTPIAQVPRFTRLHLAFPGRAAERRRSRGDARTARHVGAHGIGEKRSAGLTLSRDAWFNHDRDDAAPRDVLLLYRGPGNLPRPRSRRARPSFLTLT